MLHAPCMSGKRHRRRLWQLLFPQAVAHPEDQLILQSLELAHDYKKMLSSSDTEPKVEFRKTQLSSLMLEINMLPRHRRKQLEMLKSMILDKEAGQNSILKVFLGLRVGWGAGELFFFFFSWDFSGQKEMSDHHINSPHKKLIQKASVSG